MRTDDTIKAAGFWSVALVALALVATMQSVPDWVPDWVPIGDKTPPKIDITGPERDGIASDNDLSFQFSSDDNAATYECRIDTPEAGGSFSSCTSPKSYTDLSDGDHVFIVRATDAAGNASTLNRRFEVDTSIPTATIDAPLPDTTAGTEFDMLFSSSEENARFSCKMDNDSFRGCASPKTYTGLSDGAHTFKVRATDRAGNSPEEVTDTFTVDNTPPDTTITANPGALTKDNTPQLSFSGGALYQCWADSGTPVACTSPYDFPQLSDGAHTLNVQAFDAVGNGDPTPATFNTTIDTVAPVATVSSPTQGQSITSNSGNISFSTSPVDAGATFECRFDNTPVSPAFNSCTSPFAFAGVLDGTHTFVVRATDQAGNVGPSLTRTFSTTTVSAGPPVSIDTGPSASTNDTTADFTYSSSSGNTFECKLDGPGATTGTYAVCPGTTTGSYTSSALAEGTYTFSVKAKSGSTLSATPATRTFTVDTTAPPQPTLTQNFTSTIASPNPTFNWSSSEGGVTSQCRLRQDTPVLTNPSYAPCDGFTKSYTNLTDGTYTFFVQTIDAAGNLSAGRNKPFTVDTVAPANPPTITSGPAEGATDSDGTFDFAFTGSGETGATFQCRLREAEDTTTPFEVCVSPKSYVSVPQGTYEFRVREHDAHGNIGPAVSRGFTVASGAGGGPCVGTDISASAPQSNNLDNIVNADPAGTATTFCVLAGTHQIDNIIKLQGGDKLIGVEGSLTTMGPATFPVTYANALNGTGGLQSKIKSVKGADGLDTLGRLFQVPDQTVFNGQVKWLDIDGADIKWDSSNTQCTFRDPVLGCPKNGEGVAFATGAKGAVNYGADSALFQYNYIHDSGVNGCTSCRGRWLNNHFYRNTNEPAALGYSAGEMKGINEYEAGYSLYHGGLGNGIWCDQDCSHVAVRGTNGFWAHHNVVVKQGRHGIRYEYAPMLNNDEFVPATAENSLIEYNILWENGLEAGHNSGGGSAQDAQNMEFANNQCDGGTLAGVSFRRNYGANEATGNGVCFQLAWNKTLTRTDSSNLWAHDNDLSGTDTGGADQITGCGGTDTSPPVSPYNHNGDNVWAFCERNQ